jgi:hypothetical protein
MPLPLPGNTISFLDLATEFLDSPDYQISDYYRGGSLVTNIANNVNVPLVAIANTDPYSTANTVWNYTQWATSNVWNVSSQMYTTGSNVEKGNAIDLGNFYGATRTGSVRPLLYLTLNVSGTNNSIAPANTVQAPDVFLSVDLWNIANSNAQFVNGNTDIVLLNYGIISSNIILNYTNWPQHTMNTNLGSSSTDPYRFASPTKSNTYGLVIPGNFLPGTKITIINRGYISGSGGGGGIGTYNTFSPNTDISYASGFPGTGAIWVDPAFATVPYSNSRVSIINQGIIGGGGGGAGSTYGYSGATPGPPKSGPIPYAVPGYPGGNGAGINNSYTNPTDNFNGAYSAQIVYVGAVPPTGRNGGALAQAAPFTYGTYSSGGNAPGGAAGNAINGMAGVRFINNGGVVYGNTFPSN